jgi:hypothetical protein
MGCVRRRRKVRDAFLESLRASRARRRRRLVELTVHHARIVSIDRFGLHDGVRKEKNRSADVCTPVSFAKRLGLTIIRR